MSIRLAHSLSIGVFFIDCLALVTSYNFYFVVKKKNNKREKIGRKASTTIGSCVLLMSAKSSVNKSAIGSGTMSVCQRKIKVTGTGSTCHRNSKNTGCGDYICQRNSKITVSDVYTSQKNSKSTNCQ